MRTTRILTVLAFGASTLATAAAATEKINLGELNWPGSKVIANILKIVIENNFDAEVGIVPSTNPVVYKAMDAGNGDIDVHTDTTRPNQDNLINEYVYERGTVVLSENGYDNIQGTCIPGYMQDKYGINSIYDLADPEIAALVDEDGDGKGEWWPGANGWAVTPVEQVKYREYGLTDFYDPYIVEESVVLARLQDAYAKEEPLVFFCYKPNWTFTVYDLRVLEEPEYFEGCMDGMVQPTDDPNWYENSSVSCGWPVGKSYLAWAKTLEERAPDVAKLLGNVQLNGDIVTEFNYHVSYKGVDAVEYATNWVAENTDLINSWLAQ